MTMLHARPRLCQAIRLAGLALLGYSTFSYSPLASAQVEEILVTADGSQVMLPGAYAGNQVARGGRAGLLGNLDFMDSPFSSTNFTEALMENQQAISVADVLQNEPTVRVAKGFGNFQELYMIRGFPVYSDDMTYNGVYGILPRQFVSTEFLERVEVFRGASAFLNGAAPSGSSIGGTVNLVPKRAGNEPMTRITAGLEGAKHGYLSLDTGRRFGANQEHGLRINLAKRDGETSVDNEDRELDVLGLSYDFSGERLRLSADLGYQKHRIDAPRPAVTPASDVQHVPAPPDADSNFAQAWTYSEEEQVFAAFRGEFDLADNTTVWLGGGFRDGEEDNQLANARNVDEDGNASAYRFLNIREDDVTSVDAGIRTLFNTGSVEHSLSLSVSSLSSEGANAYASSDYAGFANNIYNPYPVTPPAADFAMGGLLASPLVTYEIDNSSVALADMMSLLDGRLMITLGVRQQDIENRSYDYNSGAQTSEYSDDKLTPMAGLVYKPSEQISLYANYIEGLLPGEVAPTESGGVPVLNAGEILSPFQSEQVEIGAKYDGGNFGGSISAYTSNMPSAYVENNIFALFGEQKNRGIELNLFGEPMEGVRIIGGLTLLDSEMTATEGNVNEGNEAIGSPDTQFNMNVEWDVAAVNGLTLDARAVYTSSQYANAANTLSVDSWTRFDIGARYAFKLADTPLMIRARLQNLTDSNDWVSVGGYPGANYLVLSTPRTLLLSATVEF